LASFYLFPGDHVQGKYLLDFKGGSVSEKYIGVSNVNYLICYDAKIVRKDFMCCQPMGLYIVGGNPRHIHVPRNNLYLPIGPTLVDVQQIVWNKKFNLNKCVVLWFIYP